MSDICLALRGGDADARNVRMMSWEAAQPHMSPHLQSFCPCLVHQTNIMTGASVKVIGESIISGMYAYAKLLRMGNYFIRTVLAVSSFVAANLHIVTTAPDEESQALNALLFDFCVMPPKARKGVAPTERQVRRFQELRAEFLMMCNGHPFRKALVHHCHPGCECGSNGDRASIVNRVSRCIIRVLYRKRPDEPQEKEWTSVWIASSFLAMALDRNEVALSVFELSVTRRPSQVAAASDALSLFPAADVERRPDQAKMNDFIGDVSWHELVGSRIKSVRGKIMHSGAKLHATLISVTTGAVEALNLQLFAHRVKLVHLTHTPLHPSNGTAQFFSAVLAESHDICRVLCGCKGWRRFAQLLRYDVEAATLIRSAFACAAVFLYARHYHPFQQYPWLLAPVHSPEVPEDVQLDIARAFAEACPRSLDVGFGRKLQAMTTRDVEFVHTAGILLPSWREVIATWAEEVQLHTFDLECGHGAQQQRTHRLNKWGLIAARSVNSTAASSIAAATQTAQRAAPPAAQRLSDKPPEPLEPLAKAKATAKAANSSRTSKYKSALQLFHRRCSVRDAALGILQVSPVSKEYWIKVKEEWAQLPAEERQALEDQSFCWGDMFGLGQNIDVFPQRFPL